MSIQKIAEQTLYAYGLRGLALAIPKIFSADNGLQKGEVIEVYRATLDGDDCLVIKKKQDKQLQSSTANLQQVV